MTERTGRPLLNYALGLTCLGTILVAVLVVGPPASSQTAATRTAKVAEGVVQSTVSGSGNLEPSSQLNLGFKTSGTVTNIYMHQGQLVTQGQLLATLDPQSAEVTLEQAKAALMAAEASLAREQETDGEGAATGAGKEATHEKTKNGKTGSTEAKTTISAATREANLASAHATVKSDDLTVRSDEQAVADTRLYAPESGTIVSLSGQVGEVVSASGTTRASSSSSSSGSGASGASGGTGRSGAGSSGSGSSGSGSAGSVSSGSGASSSGSAFAVLSDLSSMRLVVAVSESEISSVKVGQIATVTVEALEGRNLKGTPSGVQAGKLAAHVSEVATLATSSSGVVSYDVTFTLDQMESRLKPGMSATAEVVVKQAEGLSVPTSAISGGSVTVVRDGKDVRQRVVNGLAGDSSTIILSGLKAGETVVLPQATSASSATSLTSRLGSRLRGAGLGGAGIGGGGAGLAGGGGAVFFRGGG